MKRVILCFMAFLIIFGCFVFITDAEAGSKKIPEYIDNLVFKNPEFTRPITMVIPREDESGMAEDIKRTEMEADREYLECKRSRQAFKLCIPRIVIFGNLSLEAGGHLLSKSVMNFLLKNDYVRIEKIVVYKKRGSSSKGKEYKLLYYADKLKTYIFRPYPEEYSGGLAMTALINPNVLSAEIILASRTLKSIDYTNQYKGTIPPVGAKTKFHALTFSYVLKEKLPGLPKVNKVFHGKAKAYLDPDDGQWKLWHNGLKLEDSGSYEYTKLIEQQYKDAELKIEERKKSSEKEITRFTKDREGIIKDSMTGLEWYVGPDRDTTWDAASSWVNGLTIGGGGWRMPTRAELKALYLKGLGRNNIDPLFNLRACCVWSGELKGSSGAGCFDFKRGKAPWLYRTYPNARGFVVRFRR